MANKPQENLEYIKGYGENFKKLRESRGLTQKQLAELLFISDKSISFIEKEYREPTIGQVNIYRDYFDVPLDYLTGRTKAFSVTAQLISEYTGLSEESVLNLQRKTHFAPNGEPDNEWIETLDKFIQSDNFTSLINELMVLHSHSKEWNEMSVKTHDDYIHRSELNNSCKIFRYETSELMIKICDEFDRRFSNDDKGKQK